MTFQSSTRKQEESKTPDNVRIHGCEVYKQAISARTEFLFLRLHCTEVGESWGEATFNSLNSQILPALAQLADLLEGLSLDDAVNLLSRQPAWKNGRAYQIAVSAFEQAILDAKARSLGVPLYATLGKSKRSQVRSYANINRGTIDRTPSGWAARARNARDAGFEAIKIAPFDMSGQGGILRHSDQFRNGIDAIGAVRSELGAEAKIMVDCHWQFDPDDALELLESVEELDLYWIEAPILEDFLAIPDLKRIRQSANGTGVDLAGGEFLSGPREFAPFIEQGVYDVINPDIRFCGILGLVDVARMAALKGIELAPHNHLGPVMTAFGLHLMAVADLPRTIELQFGEGSGESCLLNPEILEPKNGILQVPEAPGLGADLDLSSLSRIPLK